MSPSAMPAISDADLARLLGLGSATPAMPDGFADRIVAALPAMLPPLPATLAPRRRPAPRQAGRWLRDSMAIVAGLGLATAVAAGLSRTPTFAPVLAPVMTRLAEATGLPALAPPRPAPTAPPAAPARAVPILPQAPLPPPAIVMPDPAPAALPIEVVPAPVRMPPPIERALTRPRGTGLAETLAASERRDRGVLPRAPAERAVERDASGRADPARAEPARAGIERLLPDRPAVADRPTPAGAPVADASPATPPTAKLAEPSTALPNGEPPIVRPETTAEIEELRQARKVGTLTEAQTERLRSLQLLRQQRTGRAPRDALSRRRR